jgi:hypothetical protein
LATVATTGAYSDLTGTPTLATVATSGSYTDLLDQPTIPANINDLGDVDTTGITSGQVLQYDGTNFVAATISGGGASSLDDLSDVDTATTAPTSGDALVYDGTNFVPQAVTGSGATTLDGLNDVDTTGVALNNVLKYDGTNWVDGSVAYSEVTGTPTLATVATSGSYNDLSNRPSLAIVATTGDYTDLVNTPTVPVNINDLGDVDTTGITSGQVLQYNGTSFIAATISGGGATTIEGLDNVDTTGVALNNVLKYDGTNWVDGSVAYSEVTGTPTLATVATSGSYDDLSNLPVLATVATSGSYTDLANQPSIPSAINDLTDVDTTGITSGQVLQFDGTNFVAATISGGGASALDDLSDVDTTTTAPTSGDALVYDGTNFVPQAISGGIGGSTVSYEWVELWYTSGSGGTLTAADAIQNETANITTNIVDGAGSIVEFTFSNKAYPPIAIMQYAHVTSTNEYIVTVPVTGTRKVSGGGATYDQTTLFSGSFNNVITLDCAMGNVGASAGFGQRARLYIMFMFGE